MIKRTMWIAVATIAELIKDRTVIGFFFVGFVMILGGHVIAEMAVVERVKMFVDTGIGAIFIVSVFITLLSGANLIDREMREKEYLCTLSKPVSRQAWLIGKTAGFLVTVAFLVFSLSVVLFFYVKMRTHFWRPEIFLAALFIYLEVVVLCNYVVLLSTITNQYMAVFLGVVVLLIGHMVDDLRLYWASGSEITRFATKGLFYIIPNLDAYSTAPVLYGKIPVPPGLMVSLIVTSAMYLIVATTLSMLILRKKEMA